MTERWYCPHCGTNSEEHVLRVQESYREMDVVCCYNCGKYHIREVTPKLLVLVGMKASELLKVQEQMANYENLHFVTAGTSNQDADRLRSGWLSIMDYIRRRILELQN